ncbi:hypothetical protein [Leifsonia sp. Leaf264]|uniref:hypothetical protein n=1 Tax=Leifsonia sp. Leaf264 TaxID=1736314 RepID=UPI0006FBFFDF|nr:hypothetical protein [Leifsonia sp. Leaf264]KQO98644.1 hypothetical protein ASF30_11315 [Leifsonia sp. Leaf264]
MKNEIVNGTSFKVWPKLNGDQQVGGSYKCEACGTRREYVSMSSATKFMEEHSTPGPFACKNLPAETAAAV